MGLVGELLCLVTVHARNLDHDFRDETAAAVRGGADSDLDADLRLGDIVAGFASDGAERALEASGPCGGEELLRVGAVASAVGFRAAELDVEDAVVADGVSLAAAGCCDGCRVTWFDLRHGSS